MKNLQILRLSAVAALVAVPTLCMAGKSAPPVMTPTTTSIDRGDDREDTSVFAGLNWRFGAQSSGFEAVVGVIHARVEPDGYISGARGSVHFDLDGDGGTAFRLTGFAGEDNLTGELGGGYDLETGEFFGTAGLLGDYFNLGADYGFVSGWSGFAGLHSYHFQEPDEDKKIERTTTNTTEQEEDFDDYDDDFFYDDDFVFD